MKVPFPTPSGVVSVMIVLHEGERIARCGQIASATRPDSSRRSHRMMTTVKDLHGQQFVKPLCDALGRPIHPGKSKDTDTVIAEALEEVGLPAELAARSLTDEFDNQMRASHFDPIFD
jgi:hypothetical protein